MATIRTNRDYERALHRMNELRGRGEEEEDGAELAELEAAVAAYAQQADKPADEPGRPTLRSERGGGRGG